MGIYNIRGESLLPDDIPQIKVPWVSAAHQGFSSSTVAPNTLQAFHRAFLNGANWIECDVRLTNDGGYIINHDATITVNGVTYTIANETTETLTNLVLSTDPKYGECKVTTLDRVLKLCAFTGMKANIDCKSIDPLTLSKAVIDNNMSGKSAYANMSVSDAEVILANDPNAGFIFNSADFSTWLAFLTEYHVRQKSFTWNYQTTLSAIENARHNGIGFLAAGTNASNYQSIMDLRPDMVEFIDSVDLKVINQQYLDSLDFGLNL